MQARWTMISAIALAAVALAWALHLKLPTAERTKPSEARGISREAKESQDVPSHPRAVAPARASDSASPVDVQERARFNERAREFFAQAPALPAEEARLRAADLSEELSRIERAGGLSAGETFLLRAGLIRATVDDEQEQVAQIRALKKRYEANTRQRHAQAVAQPDPMFQLYKVRESQIVAEIMSLETIPDGLSRDEYLRRRLQAEREQLLGDEM